MSGKINKEYSSLYEYDFKVKDGVAYFELKGTNEQFEQIQIELTSDEICVQIDGQVPFICGQLLYEVEEKYTSSFKDGTFFIGLNPKNKGVEEWGIPIVGPSKDSKIDPMSSFVLYSAIRKQELKKKLNTTQSFEFLKKAADFNFIPAVIAYSKNFPDGEDCLNKSYQLNQDPYIAFVIAMKHLKKENYKEALTYFTAAYEGNNELLSAKSYAGFILSPYTKIHYREKDAKKAKELFEEVIAKDPNDIIAKEGLKHFKDVKPDVKEDKVSTGKIVAFSCVAAAAIGSAILFISRKNKK